MKVLALDASTKATGLAIFQDKELLGYSTIRASSTDLINRIHKMTDTIDTIISEANIDTIIMEEVIPDHSKNQHTFKALIWLQAVIIVMVHDKHPSVKVELIYPGSWRAQAGIKTGRGVKRDTLKEADIKRAKEIFGAEQLNDDEADACLIGGVYVGIFGAPINDELNWE